MKWSSLKFSLGTIFSRVTGLVRDQLITATFGASPALDAYILATRIPNLFRDMLAEGSLGSAFTRVFASQESKADRVHFFWVFFILGGLFLLFSTVVVYFTPAFWVGLVDLTGSLDPERYALTVSLTPVLFPVLGLAVLISVVMGVLNVLGRFFVTGVAPALVNLVVAGACVFIIASPTADMVSSGVFLIAYALVLGFLVHLLFLLLIALRNLRNLEREEASTTHPLINWEVQKKNCRSTMRLMFPASLAASTASLSSIINSNFAATLVTGSITWLNFGFRLLQLPVGVFAVATATVVLPKVTKQVESLKKKEASTTEVETYLNQACSWVLGWMGLSFLYLYALSPEITSLLFERGSFTATDSLQTATALRAYSFSVFGYGMMKLLHSIYFAFERTSYSLKISFMSLIINVLFNAALLGSMQHVGIAMATSISLSFNAIFLWWGLKQFSLSPQRILPVRTVLSLLAILMLVGQGLIYGNVYLKSQLVMGKQLQNITILTIDSIGIFLILAGLWYMRKRRL